MGWENEEGTRYECGGDCWRTATKHWGVSALIPVTLQGMQTVKSEIGMEA